MLSVKYLSQELTSCLLEHLFLKLAEADQITELYSSSNNNNQQIEVQISTKLFVTT